MSNPFQMVRSARGTLVEQEKEEIPVVRVRDTRLGRGARRGR